MGVVAMGRRLGDLPKGLHSSTFGGNPLACAAGIAAIQYMQDYNLVDRSRELGEYLLKELQKINSKLIREVRGLGLMIGIELKQKAQEYIRALMAEGVLAIPAGPTILRLLPPLVIQKEDIDFAVQKIAEVLKNGR